MENTVRVRITSLEGELLDSFDAFVKGAPTARDAADVIGIVLSLNEQFDLTMNTESN
jgi:hypothetical protein